LEQNNIIKLDKWFKTKIADDLYEVGDIDIFRDLGPMARKMIKPR